MPNITRDVQITWTAVPGTVNYIVFRKTIVPTASDFNFVTNVSAPITSYTFVGSDEDERDVYQVKAVDANNVLIDDANAIQTISFPNASSGIWTTDTITPDGQPMNVPVDVPYLTKDEFLLEPIAKGLGYSTSHLDYLDGSLDKILLRASAVVNRYCNRYFQKMTIDETFPNVTIQVQNPKLCVIPLNNGPVRRVNSITIQVLKWFIPFSREYLIPFYQQNYYQIVPMLSTSGQGAPMGTGTPIPSVILEQSQLGIIWTNYTCGYDIIPEDIKYATALVAGKMLGLGRHNPLGLAQFNTQTTRQIFSKTATENPIDDEVEKILRPYKYNTLRFT